MELKTNRFLLRDFTEADTAAFEAYHDDPRSQEFDGAEEGTRKQACQLLALFKAWASSQPRLNYQLAIVRRNSPQVLIGCCGVRCESAEIGTAELGIELAPDYWGRHAYAIEVMNGLVEFAFNTLGLQEVYGSTVSANSRIARLVRAFGATAVAQPSPAWMSSRGWTQIEWRIGKQQWQSGRLTRPSIRRAKARGHAPALGRQGPVTNGGERDE